MAQHGRRFAEESRTVRTGVVVGITLALLALALGAIVYVNVRGAGNDGSQSGVERTVVSDQSANSSTDATSSSPTDAAAANGSNSNSSGSSATDATKKDEKKSEDAKGDDVKSDSANSTTDAASGDSASGDASGNGSARMGNAYVNGDDVSGDGTEDSQGDSGEGDASGSGESSSSASDGGTSGSSAASSRSVTPPSGWIDAEACATEWVATGNTTASTIDWDDESPQIGIDMSSSPHGLFGDYVEIKYGDETVTAQVVDCGHYGSGEWGIILNPGVYEEFGVYDSDEWGRRDVSYRFV